ncbi:MAG: SAM-dependent chlorinase/fluorinase, partial [Chloroflexi bacterium]|nr:SAM-dependent chlorinase/fluorinase [Chloroflexota bacterium]
ITTLVVTPEWHTALRTHGVSAWLEGKMLEPVRTYGEQEAGTLVVLAGSAGLLEVASPGGSAQEMTGARRGVELRVRVSKLA